MMKTARMGLKLTKILTRVVQYTNQIYENCPHGFETYVLFFLLAVFFQGQNDDSRPHGIANPEQTEAFHSPSYQ